VIGVTRTFALARWCFGASTTYAAAAPTASATKREIEIQTRDVLRRGVATRALSAARRSAPEPGYLIDLAATSCAL
jgi:hypothetical protein